MISFTDVTKKYGGRVVLSSVTFLVEPGEFVFLIGKSGSGKTTIMRLLTAQAKHDEGEIKVGDLPLTHLHPKQVRTLRRMIGVIYQDHKLLPELTVAENIAMGLEILGKSKEEIQKL
jgi:cell division transport system ATP-binding protein